MSEKNSVNPVKYLLCGGFGGVCTVAAGHPFDTIKVRLQTMPKATPGEAVAYTGAWDCTKKTIKREGFWGLYKGMGAPIAGVAPISAISFMVFGIGKRMQMKSSHDELTLTQLFLAGAFSGIFTASIIAPGERIKCLLQIQPGGTAPPKYAGPVDALKQLYKEGGIRSIYKGTVATLLRDVPARGMYFMTYELFQRILAQLSKSGEIGALSTIVAGGSAGISTWLVALPADVLKSRLQTAPEGTFPNGMRDVFKVLMKEEGPRALYKGVVPVLLRAFPANAACSIGFELCMKFLNSVAPNY
ncbi:Congested-like trachea protein [Cryptotermes secundus]|uniref:Congested-like trachea protein n=1 Tax=Cryptotermes secundus TaxID=105785 RepID=A0A2J7PXR0_9NEOP|nr:congested-like trachea protein [Cryptotermes secundus]PNF21104.1 Congested-like trachea protein [Cryptotermes secundus]